MANPTGSYLAANNSYVWIDGDVYKIAQTDQVEGAANGASFSGLGVLNAAPQALLNKIQVTHNKQLTDEANIAALQEFIAGFTSTVGVSGWCAIEVKDSSRGQMQIIEQWGQVLFGVRLGGGLYGPYSFPRPFPAVCANIVFTTITNGASDGGYGSGKNIIMIPNDVPPSTTGFWVYNNAEVSSANSAMGFYFHAIGF